MKLRRNWLMIWTDRLGMQRTRRYGLQRLADRDARLKRERGAPARVVYASEVGNG